MVLGYTDTFTFFSPTGYYAAFERKSGNHSFCGSLRRLFICRCGSAYSTSSLEQASGVVRVVDTGLRSFIKQLFQATALLQRAFNCLGNQPISPRGLLYVPEYLSCTHVDFFFSCVQSLV